MLSFDFLQKRKIPLRFAAVFLVLILGALWYVLWGRGGTPDFESVAARVGDVREEVSITGRIKAAESVVLAFEKTGKIAWLGVGSGDVVYKGQTLAQLENADIVAERARAEAQVRIQEAKLNELLAGAREEDIAVQEVKVKNTEIALADAQQNLINALYDAYTKSDDAIRNKTDQFFTNPRSANPSINFPITDPQLEIDIKLGRVNAEATLVAWEADLTALSPKSDLAAFVLGSHTHLGKVKLFLNKVSFAVNALTASASFSQTTIDGYKADISTARTNVNTAASNLSNAFEKLKAAESNMALQRQELVLKKSGTREENILAQRAYVEEAEASVRNYNAQLGKTVIRAPFGGIVTKTEVKVGEIVSANTPVVSLISDNEFEIEAYIPEADIAKAKIGNSTRVTLDAYGDSIVFPAHVVFIEPAETILDGVATYKTTLQFDTKDERVRSGMTANADIVTGTREHVIIIPSRAVIDKDDMKVVRKFVNKIIEEVPVTVGLRGFDGNIEIIEGVREGDVVITFLK